MAMGVDDTRDARGMAVADFDNDGDLDIVINSNQGGSSEPVPPVLLRNDIGHTRDRLVVDLTGIVSNRDAIGAKVVVHAVDKKKETIQLLRHVTAGGGYASQNSKRLYFGLGSYSHIESLTVTWPSGKTHEFLNVATNQLVRISEDGELNMTSLLGHDVDLGNGDVATAAEVGVH